MHALFEHPHTHVLENSILADCSPEHSYTDETSCSGQLLLTNLGPL